MKCYWYGALRLTVRSEVVEAVRSQRRARSNIRVSGRHMGSRGHGAEKRFCLIVGWFQNQFVTATVDVTHDSTSLPNWMFQNTAWTSHWSEKITIKASTTQSILNSWVMWLPRSQSSKFGCHTFSWLGQCRVCPQSCFDEAGNVLCSSYSI